MTAIWSASVRSYALHAFSKSESVAARSALQAKLSARNLASNLRHTDDQNVAGLSAVLAAIDSRHESVDDFSGWSVIAAPRAPGLSIMNATLARYAIDGVWGVSPHVIPHCSLHSLSGILSVILGIHGVNVGVGGTVGRESEVFRAAIAVCDEFNSPGVWLVMTGWELHATDSRCLAAALALTKSSTSQDTARLSIQQSHGSNESPQFTLESFFRDANDPRQSAQRWSLAGGGQVDWIRRAVGQRESAA